MPYRTLDDRIDGVVITLADITGSKSLEVDLRDKQAALEERVAEQSAMLDKAEKHSQTDSPAGQRSAKRGSKAPRSDKT
jgi:hypothetical protein